MEQQEQILENNIYRPKLLIMWSLGLVAITLFGLLLGGEARLFASNAIPLLFMGLALFAYLGERSQIWRVISIGYTLLLIGSTALFSMLLTISSMLEYESGQPRFPANSLPLILLLLLVTGLVAAISLLGFIPTIRQWLSKFLPIDPYSFVHTIALVSIIGLTTIMLSQVFFSDIPPLLNIMAQAEIDKSDPAADMRSSNYNMIWCVITVLFAVGYGLKRNFRQTLERLGVVKPSLKQLGIALAAAIAMVLGATLLNMATQYIWDFFGWPTTDGELFEELIGFAFSFVGALVLGITAGVSEELAIRGALQPRLGILLSNLFFTSLHAMQYHWDSLLLVFCIGIILGLLRKYTNTTVAIITHATYNFLLAFSATLFG